MGKVNEEKVSSLPTPPMNHSWKEHGTSYWETWLPALALPLTLGFTLGKSLVLVPQFLHWKVYQPLKTSVLGKKREEG